MQYTKKSNTGKFATKLTITFPDDTLGIIAKFTAASVQTDICDRAVKKAFKVGKAKKDELKSILDIVYNEVNVARAEKAVEEFVEKMVEENPEIDELAIDYKITGEWVAGEGGESSMVMATTLVDAMERDEGLRAAYLMVFEAQGMQHADTATREELIEFAHSKGHGVRPAK